MFGELVPQGGGDPVPLLKTKLLVGRRDSCCDIALRFPNVSSRHCELELVSGYWLVRDLGSSNGTKVNGVRVRSKWVMPGDELAVAKHRFKIDYDVAEGVPPPPPLVEDEVDMGTSLLEKAGLMKRRSERPGSERADSGPSAARPGSPGRDTSAPGQSRRSNGHSSDQTTDEDDAANWLAEGDE
jgi:pSer/pThr/pTyr-binding forkhead associated (FHA) protein